jgi:glycosyltransferase involved in cell wall biosynthesis
MIYEYLQDHFGWKFKIILSATDSFSSDRLEISRHDFFKLGSSLQPLIPYCPSILSKEVNGFEPDALLGLDPLIYGQGVQLIKFSRKEGLCVFVDVSNTILGYGRRGLLEELWLQWRGKSFARVTGIIATAPKCLERLASIRKMPKDLVNRTCILGHPYDDRNGFPCQKRDDGMKSIVVVSRLVLEKGIFYILEASLTVLKDHPDWDLVFVGDGPLRSFIHAWASDKGLGERVHCRGEVSPHEVKRQLCKAHIYLSHALDTPSWEEFFGIANVEAMACGLAVIVSDSGAIPWVIRQEGLVEMVRQRDVSGLASALGRLVVEEELRLERSQRAMEYVSRHYSLTVIAERFRAFLESKL